MTKYDHDNRAIDDARKEDEPLPLRRVDLTRLERKGFFAKAKAAVASSLIPLVASTFRRFSPVRRAFGFVWVTRHADVLAVLEDQEAFQTPYGAEMADLTGTVTFALGDDGEIHERQRKAMLAAWQAIDLQHVRARARAVADALIEDAGGRIDVTRELFPHVTAQSATEVLGLRVQDMPGFIDAALACNSLLFADPDGDPAFRLEARLGARVLRPIVDEAVADAMASASGDGANLLVRAAAWYRSEHIDDRVAKDDLTAIAYGLIIGYSPTASLFASGVMRTLLKKPSAFAATREAAYALRVRNMPDEPSQRRFDALVLELGRFHPALTPGQFRVRTGAKGKSDPEGRLGAIRAGETVIAATSTSVDDPARVRKPHRFDPTRSDGETDPSVHAAYGIMFGHGAHACLGRHLSIAIVGETLASLMSRDEIAFAQRFPRMATIGPVPGTLEMVWQPDGVTAVQSQITAAIPLRDGVDENAVRDTLGNLLRSGKVGAAFDESGIVHFASFNVLALGRRGKERPHLFVELNVDGRTETALNRIWDFAGPLLEQALGGHLSGDSTLRERIALHSTRPGRRPWGDVGLNFVGTGEFSVAQIAREKALADHLNAYLFAHETYTGPPLTEPDPEDPNTGIATESRKFEQARTEAIGAGFEDMLHRVRSRGPAFARDPLIPFEAFLLRYAAQPLFVLSAAGLLLASLVVLALALVRFLPMHAYVSVWLVPLLVTLTALVGIAVWIRSSERNDRPDPAAVSLERFRAIREAEERAGHAQTHITTVTTMKAGLLRRLTFAFSLHVVASFSRLWFRRGFLTDFATIHYARWLRLKGTDQMLFQSNFDGSWQSYLEDFVTKVHGGQTLVWSNGEGFPSTRWLFLDGARDGDRFKRWVRRQQVATPFWYSRFPDLTIPQIHANALIRDGLARARDVSEHRDWLKLFGSLPRPERQFERDQIQSLVFRGLGTHRTGACIPVRFDDPVKVRRWFARVSELAANDRNISGLARPELALRVGDARVNGDALFVALSAGGLEKLGLGREAGSGLDTFPGAFLDGMGRRAQALGDHGAPLRWLGSGADGSRRNDASDAPFDADAVVLVYAADRERGPDDREPKVAALSEMEAAGMTCAEPIDMSLKNGSRSWGIKMEFAEGASQPVMRGTDRAARGHVPDHDLLEPGEFVLGYEDSRGYVAPEIAVRGDAASKRTLPLSGDARKVPYPYFGDPERGDLYDLGRNGSFLVIRQLRTDHRKFASFVDRATVQVMKRFDPLLQRGDGSARWAGETDHDKRIKRSLETIADYFPAMSEHVLAKVMGRWPDGSSLVRHPVFSATAQYRLKVYREVGVAARKNGISKVLERLEEQAPNPLVWHDDAWAYFEDFVRAQGIDVDELVPPPGNVMDNDFLFGRDDPQGLACPIGSHVRRANPRDTPNPGNADQIAINNRHRIIRRGRTYDRRFAVDGNEMREEGILFMCLNADIERQFEFIQQTWLNAPHFQGLSRSPDPIAAAHRAADRFIIPHENSHTQLRFTASEDDQGDEPADPLQRFNDLVGGGYFFLPSLAALRYVGRPDR